MWGGVTRGLAGVKLSGSPRRLGENSAREVRAMSKATKPRRSLYEKYGWNEILSASEFKPAGLLDPVSWMKRRWISVIAAMMNGSRKWKAKNRVRVALSTEKPPQIHWTRVFPMYGTAERRFVMTVAPQKDICPQGRTYPTKAVIMTRRSSTTPMFQASLYR